MLQLFNRILILLNSLFRKDEVTINLTNSLDTQLNNLENNINNLNDNLFLQTSTWALDILEKELSLKNTKNKSLGERRSVISAKWRGVGTLTLEKIKDTVKAYVNGDINVYFDGIINIEFVSNFGVPPNIEDVYKSIEAIKPAHLGVKYLFKYRTHGDLRVYLHQDLKNNTHKELREGEIRWTIPKILI